MAKGTKKVAAKAAPVKENAKAAPSKNPPKGGGKHSIKQAPVVPVKHLTGTELIERQRRAKFEKKLEKGKPVKTSEVKKYLLPELMKMYAVTVDPLNEYVCNISFLSKLSRPEMFEFISNIIASITENSTFYPTPAPALSAITDEIGYYTTARSNGKTTLANEHLANIKYLMRQLAIYVANTCGNLLSTLECSGFIANKKTRGPSKDMYQVVIRSAKDTNMIGTGEATYDEMPGATLYNGQWCLRNVEGAPMNAVSGSVGVKMDFEGLPSKDWVLLFVRAKGPKGTGNWSDGFPFFPR
jgi:hypothetical protein